MILKQLGNRLYFKCPGCRNTHCVQIKPGTPAWDWNGSWDKPTFTPSVLYEPDHPNYRCHFYVRDGRIEYLMDCHHDLRGTVVPMEEMTDGPGD